MFQYRMSEKYIIFTKDEKNLNKIKNNLISNQNKYYKFLYPEWTHSMKNYEIELLTSNLNKNQKILEIGSGDGYLANILAEKYHLNITASDLEPRYPQYTKVFKADGQSNKFQDKEYDVIISSHVLEHIEDIDMAMDEFKRLLKDDGKMYHIVPSRGTMLFTTLVQPLAYIRGIYLHLNGYYLSKYQPLKNKNILRFIKSFILSLNPTALFWGAGHGVYNRLDCFKYWSIKNWTKVFNRNDLKVEKVKYSNISNSMHKIFPFKFIEIREYIAKWGGIFQSFYIKEKKLNESILREHV